MTKLNSPGMKSFESKSQVSRISGAAMGTALMIGIAEWGEIGKPIEVLSFPDFEKKLGSFLSGYYLAKCADTFFKEGGQKLHVVRTAHYTAGVLDAEKANLTVQGLDAGTEDQAKVNTIKFTATGEGLRGNKINVKNKKATTTLNGAITIAAHTSCVVTDVTDFEIGDVVDIDDSAHHVRIIVTHINTGTKTLYFKSVTFAAGIADAATVKTASRHAVKTVLTADIASDATSAELNNINGVELGSILTIVDTQSGAPNRVTVKVTDISLKTISFADIGAITTIAVANSEVVSQEFNLEIYFKTSKQGKTYEYLSMVSENEKYFIENVLAGNEWLSVEDLESAEDDIGDLPLVFDLEYLASGDDGLVGLTGTDFIGTSTLKNGLFAFDALPDQFAQICSPDQRGATFQDALKDYAENKLLWTEFDIDFDKTPEEAKEYVLNTAMLNTNIGEINYPNVKWMNPYTGIIHVIPQSGAVMGLNARIWGALGKGCHIAAAGVEDGVFRSIEGFESEYTKDKDYRDLLYTARINALYRYPAYGNLKYGIRTLEINGDFPQVPERVVFLYCRHSIIAGTPWIVFKNNDVSNRARLKKTVEKFLRGLWKAGWLKGLTEAEAFTVDVSVESVNTVERQEAGEIWCSVGLATKKASEFAYFEFNKKVGV